MCWEDKKLRKFYELCCQSDPERRGSALELRLHKFLQEPVNCLGCSPKLAKMLKFFSKDLPRNLSYSRSRDEEIIEVHSTEFSSSSGNRNFSFRSNNEKWRSELKTFPTRWHLKNEMHPELFPPFVRMWRNESPNLVRCRGYVKIQWRKFHSLGKACQSWRFCSF